MKGSTNASARPNIRIQDASAEFVANTDTSTNAEFPYRASVSITGVTHYMSATVIYSQAQCISGAYSTYCQTYDGGVYLYAKTNVGTQTIPAISCDISVNYINVENVPTSGSQSVITSGGVYTALSGKQNTLTFDSTPTDGSSNPVTSDGVYDALSTKANTTQLTDGSVTKLGTASVGSDTKPIKLVNGVPTPVSYDFVDTNSSQVINGYKTFKTNITTRSLNALGTNDYPITIQLDDKNGNFLFCLRCNVAPNGKVIPYITARNADGTTRDITLDH